MPTVAVVTVQKELFKNVAEILLEAQAAGNLISRGLARRREEGRHPRDSQGGAATLPVLGTGDSPGLCVSTNCSRVFFAVLLGFQYPRVLDLEREKLGGELNE